MTKQPVNLSTQEQNVHQQYEISGNALDNLNNIFSKSIQH